MGPLEQKLLHESHLRLVQRDCLARLDLIVLVIATLACTGTCMDGADAITRMTPSVEHAWSEAAREESLWRLSRMPP
eukprot:370201-Amphidinium_carterae.1